MKKYKIEFMKDYTYEVIEVTPEYYSGEYGDSAPTTESSVFQGSLSDCEAYIRLHEGGYM